MPMYEYDCPDCGMFSAFGSLAAYAAPQPCPICSAASARNLMASPSLKPAPVSAAAALRKVAAGSRHPAVCGCCAPARPRLRAETVGPA